MASNADADVGVLVRKFTVAGPSFPLPLPLPLPYHYHFHYALSLSYFYQLA